MPVIITASSGDQHHYNLAKYLVDHQYSRPSAMQWLRSKHYTVRGTKFNGISVLGIMQGLENNQAMSTNEPNLPSTTYEEVYADIESKLVAGSLKYTKAKGLHTPTAKATPAVERQTDSDDIPF